MSTRDLARIVTAHELRQQAERYRYLALCIGDQPAVMVIERMSRLCDERASEIERDVLERMPACRDHAA